MLIIGVTGTLGAGKGTIVEYLVKEKGFKHYSVREYLADILRKKGVGINRESLVNLGNDLRKKYGADYIARELYKKAKKYGKNSIIESIRNVGEANSLKRRENFYLFAVDAKAETRYKRIIKRGSETDKISFNKFIYDERKEMSSSDSDKQNISKVMELADFKFDNNDKIDKLFQQIEKVFNEIQLEESMKKSKTKPKKVKSTKNEEEKYIRPSWDEYFVEVANAISKRATCDRGRTGCVIAKDNQILVTGYVGSPVGLPHCDDAGHQMKKLIHEDGSITQHCVRTVHGEENAICQAAKRGISIEGATIYTRMTPCRVCAMLLINAGIKRVYCERIYHDNSEPEAMFKKAGVKIEYKYNEFQKYKNQ